MSTPDDFSVIASAMLDIQRRYGRGAWIGRKGGHLIFYPVDALPNIKKLKKAVREFNPVNEIVVMSDDGVVRVFDLSSDVSLSERPN